MDYAIVHQADVVLFAGDAFRTRNPDPTHQREFALRMRRLSDAKIATLLLVGNHDVPVMEQRASSIEIFDTLGVPCVVVVSKPDVLRFETPHGPVQIAAIPYPVRQRLLTREQFRKLDQESLDRAVSEAVVSIIRELAGRLDPDLPAILAGHFSVESAHWGSERNIMIGRDVTVPLSTLLDPTWDYVALGHIHQHQNLNPDNTPPVIYPGSLERVDFGEERQPKGFVWVEIWPGQFEGAGPQSGRTEWRYIEVPARPFITLRVDVRAEDKPLDAIREAIARLDLVGAVVRLIVQMTPEQEPRLRDADISPWLADAFFAQINRDVDRDVRDRLENVETDAMTPVHLLETYLRSKGKAPDEIVPYLQQARIIFSEDDALDGLDA